MSRKSRRKRQRIESPSAQSKASGPLVPKEVLDRLPAEVRVSVAEAAAFSGPLPPPSMFGQYDQILEGSAARIMEMAEREQSHRIGWEGRRLDVAADETTRGQWMGFAVSILCIAGTVVLAMLGHEWPAVVLGGAGAANLVGRFLEGRSPGARNARSNP